MFLRDIIVLGSNGFIGSKMLIMLSENLLLSKLIYQNTKNLDFIGGSYSDFKLENIYNKNEIDFNEISDEVIVINCAAERQSNLDIKIRDGNYNFQLNVLSRLLKEDKNILWIQLESYWQNSLEVTPSPRYVYWKNEFRLKLIETSNQNRLKVLSIVLPHVIGVNDNKNRYLNKIFASINKSERVTLENSENLFYLCDIDDVCKYITELTLQPEKFNTFKSSLFPFHTIRLNELVNQFKGLAKSCSVIDFEVNKRSKNPLMHIGSQPALISSKEVSLSSLESSLSKILIWLKQED